MEINDVIPSINFQRPGGGWNDQKSSKLQFISTKKWTVNFNNRTAKLIILMSTLNFLILLV